MIKIAYFYHSGPKMSWLRHLSVVTFKKHNPDWRVEVYTDDPPYVVQRDEWFCKMAGASDELVYVDFKTLGFKAAGGAGAVHKSDWLRWKLLHDKGGLWLDTDQVFFKPIPDAEFEGCDFALQPIFQPLAYCINYVYSNPGKLLISMLNKASNANYDAQHYESMGNDMLRLLFKNPWEINEKFPGANFRIVPVKTTIPVPWLKIGKLFSHLEVDMSESLACHWFGGNVLSQRMEHTFQPLTYLEFECVLAYAIHRALTGGGV